MTTTIEFLGLVVIGFAAAAAIFVILGTAKVELVGAGNRIVVVELEKAGGSWLVSEEKRLG